MGQGERSPRVQGSCPEGLHGGEWGHCGLPFRLQLLLLMVMREEVLMYVMIMYRFDSSVQDIVQSLKYSEQKFAL